jgi:H/ACA ribonucleoprotein complex subunit 2
VCVCVCVCVLMERRLQEDLGAAGGTKRPTSVVLVKRNADFASVYDEVATEVKKMPLPI